MFYNKGVGDVGISATFHTEIISLEKVALTPTSPTPFLLFYSYNPLHPIQRKIQLKIS